MLFHGLSSPTTDKYHKMYYANNCFFLQLLEESDNCEKEITKKNHFFRNNTLCFIENLLDGL